MFKTCFLDKFIYTLHTKLNKINKTVFASFISLYNRFCIITNYYNRLSAMNTQWNINFEIDCPKWFSFIKSLSFQFEKVMTVVSEVLKYVLVQVHSCTCLRLSQVTNELLLSMQCCYRRRRLYVEFHLLFTTILCFANQTIALTMKY